MLKAHHVMRRRVETLSADMSLQEAAEVLLDRGYSGAPVVDAAGKVVGVLSQRDFAAAQRDSLRGREPIFYREGDRVRLSAKLDEQSPSRPVREVMSREIISVDEGTGIVEIARLMSDRKVHRVIVMRGDKVAGLISSLDILRALADAFHQEPERPRGRPAGRRPAAGGARRGRTVAKRKA